MNYQTRLLFSVVPPSFPRFIQPLLNAYKPYNSASTLQMNLFAEPYYGDFLNCSAVLLTHNPGSSNIQMTGLGSPYHSIINSADNTPEYNYNQIATIPNFPNKATNAWINCINYQFQNHFDGIQTFSDNKLFIRDLVPYHSTSFGNLDMMACYQYLYRYFFNQVIETSFRSKLYHRINQNKSRLSSIIYARGSVWKHPKMGLSAIGWNLIGKIYCNCFIYKADFNKISKLSGFDEFTLPKDTLLHDIYIVVIAQVKPGAPFGIYKNRSAPLIPIELKDVIVDYNSNTTPSLIDHNSEMDLFFANIS